jgi:hypothetical protein
MVSRRKLLNAQLIAIDLSPAPTEDEKQAFDARMIPRAAILAEFEELSCGN